MAREYTAEEEAFLNQNGWAADADVLLQQAREGDPAWEAFAGAVMALAFEQFKNTHWIESAIRDHAKETGK